MWKGRGSREKGVKGLFNKDMDEAFEMAELALKSQEVPVGCVIQFQGATIARGCNEVNITKNATRHAEMVAIDQVLAYSKSHSKSLKALCGDSRVYVTVEPCIMCAYALRQVGLLNIVYGCKNERFGGCGSVLDIHEAEVDPSLGKLSCSFASELDQERAKKLLKRFYEGANPNTASSDSNS